MKRARDRYDLVFSIGQACSCSWALRAAGLQFASYPFDWVANVDLVGRSRIVADDFRDWIVPDRMEIEAGKSSYNCDIYHNRVTGMGFNHDFPKGVPFKESLPAVLEKYHRRIGRLFADIRRSRRVLIAWVGVPGCGVLPADHVATCLKTFRDKFPGVEFRMLVIESEQGVSAKAPRIEEGDGFERLSFDYEDRSKAGSRFQVKMKLLERVLSRIEAVDYRTPEQKRAYASTRHSSKNPKYAQYGATTWLGYVIRRRLVTLRRHFEKRREKSGGRG